MRLIQQSLEAEEEARPDLCDSTQYPDICAITSILKQYFRDLPNPLFPYECYDRLMDSVGKEGKGESFGSAFEPYFSDRLPWSGESASQDEPSIQDDTQGELSYDPLPDAASRQVCTFSHSKYLILFCP